MIEMISKLPILVQIIAGVAAFNIALSGIKAGLELIKDKTQSDLDNKAYAAIDKLISFIAKLLDLVGYNPEHK